MVFSWKKAKKDAIKRMKLRRQNYLKNGRNQEAKDLERKIERKEKENA